jgi:hypothetical protein
MKKSPHARAGVEAAPRLEENGHVAVAADVENVALADLSPNGDGSLTPAVLGAILAALQTMRDGNFSIRLPVAWTGLEGKIADTFNDIIAANEQMARELKRVGLAIGKEGKTRERIRFQQLRGAWGEMEVSVNTLTEDLLRPTSEVTRAIAAVAQGNLTQTVRLDVDGRRISALG